MIFEGVNGVIYYYCYFMGVVGIDKRENCLFYFCYIFGRKLQRFDFIFGYCWVLVGVIYNIFCFYVLLLGR